jgi:hypothetical protein
MAEMVKSQAAARLGLRNTPGPAATQALILLCHNVLEPVRAHFGRPVIINSGFRATAVNRAVGGSGTSQHVRGEAADIEIPGVANGDVAKWIRDNLPFDQLILEAYTPGKPSSGWVHVSYSVNRMRKQVLTATPKRGAGMVYSAGLQL